MFEVREEEGSRRGAVARVGSQLGIHHEALRKWVREAEVDQGMRPGVTNGERDRLAALEKENRELRRANEMAGPL